MTGDPKAQVRALVQAAWSGHPVSTSEAEALIGFPIGVAELDAALTQIRNLDFSLEDAVDIVLDFMKGLKPGREMARELGADGGAERHDRSSGDAMGAMRAALGLSGLAFEEKHLRAMIPEVHSNAARWAKRRAMEIPRDVPPPFYFSALVPGMEADRETRPFRLSDASFVKRPERLEEAAFWPVRHLGELIRTRQVTATELTQMYLSRLHRYNPVLNCVVTFLDHLALEQAKQADVEIAAGGYKGPLHGIPWGAKDLIAVRGHKTTWGSSAFAEQVLDEDASVVSMLRDAGAVLVAKLATGELARSADNWFGGKTRNPWNPAEGASGSSSGSASATSAGLVGFSLGTNTGGSILYPARRCGVTGFVPTFGRVSRNGVMTQSWTHDRVGPMCRHAEDCALVMSAIAKPDGRDLSVAGAPFNFDARLDVKKLRVGYIPDGFDDEPDPVAKSNGRRTLERLETLGVRLVPLRVPAWDLDVDVDAEETGAFFDGMLRSGGLESVRDERLGDLYRSAQLTPAVEYLQTQRLRMLVMMKLADSTAGFDVYVASQPREGLAYARSERNDSERHEKMASAAGYPALIVPNGLRASGTPTSVTFFGRPFKCGEVLALAAAYQDTARHHFHHPAL